jgi:protein disulfide-isomerase
MLYFKRSMVLILAVLFIVNSISFGQKIETKAVGPKWYTSYEQAAAEAKKSGKPLMMLFTGSDWCRFCILLQKEVLSTSDFKDWAKQEVVLLEVDFPHDKTQTKEIVEQNNDLQTKYQVEGYPTLVILDPAGRQIASMGYPAGKGKEWLQSIKKGIADYYQFRFVEPKLNFAKALVDAKTDGDMLLVIKEDENSIKEMPELFTDKDFVTLAASGMDVAIYEQKAASEDATAFKEFSGKHGLAQASVVLADAKNDQILYKSNNLAGAKELVEQLTKSLPKIAYDGQWLENYDKAMIIAAQQKKPMLLTFVGSDWCKWCKKLEKDVLSQKEFEDFAKKNLVLVKLDYPRKKQQAQEIVQQNRRLEKKYDKQGFPTVIVTDCCGKELGRIKYRQQTITEFIDKIKEFTETAEAQGGK